MNDTARAVKASAGQGTKGSLTGVTAGPADRQVVVYWHGKLTPAAKAIIADSETPVVVKPAKYSARELVRAVDQVSHAAKTAGVQLVSVMQPEDGSGLRVSMEGGQKEAAKLRRAVKSADLPVKIISGVQRNVSLADRRNGQFAGGAAMAEPICSTAFAIQQGNQQMMLTAEHCFPGNYSNNRYGLTTGELTMPDHSNPFGHLATPKGPGPNSNVRVDVAGISPQKAIGPEIWAGKALDRPTEQHLVPVTGAQAPIVGNYVCQSGARSGEICNLHVSGINPRYWATEAEGEPPVEYSQGLVAEQMSDGLGVYGAMRGDSGGPVVMGTPGQRRIGTEVIAAGVVSASHSSAMKCPRGPLTGQSKCFSAFTFVPIDVALNHLNYAELSYRHTLPNGMVELKHKSFKDDGIRGPFDHPPIENRLQMDARNNVQDLIVAGNGTALAFHYSTGQYAAVPQGGTSPESRWIPRRNQAGRWEFHHAASPDKALEGGTGFQVITVIDGWFQLKNLDGRCLALDATISAQHPHHATTPICDAGDIDQWFSLEAVSTELSVEIPAQATSLPSPPTPGTTAPRLAVMPLGDSITLGVGSTTRRGYRPELATHLAGAASSLSFTGSQTDSDGTRHEGHSGWRIDQLQANIETWLAQAKPNIITLHIGTNDMNRDHQVSTAPQRLGRLLDQIHAASPDTAIVLATLVPATDPAVQARVDAYNKTIPALVSARTSQGRPIVQVSMGSLTTADLNDNLHPNNAGYTKMADAFHGGVQTLIRRGWIKENVVVDPAPPRRTAVIGDYDVDINGDGQADYLVVDDNGATRAWTNTGIGRWSDQGVVATGSAQWTGEQVRFADINGDQRADYLVLDANGATRALLNTPDAT
ncbi:GDSL-type esterase/lipase family protein, partial [Streptomyces sp. NPDC057638]|uniref:GDSL-type esterase/lipase family protein n=1 Tax=Streptomyces sp. NPDC057638 TaxID=3346190 RepID=UPI0036B3F72A